MKRYIVSCLIILTVIVLAGSYFFKDYWEHRFDEIIARQAVVYRVDPRLVWSIIYVESWFRPWKIGTEGEVGLMQVTPLVARDWAHDTGLSDYERQANDNVVEFLRDPERNIQIGCWYFEKLREQYRGRPAETAMALASYNAGPSRVDDWTKNDANLSESEFVQRIGIPSTKAYVTNILERYRTSKPAESSK
jgi:peptidoglycan lytic transglycosylase